MKFWNLLLNKKGKKPNNILQYGRLKPRNKNDCQLRSKLIYMLDGDGKKADELIARARFCDPGKSYKYYCYKAILNWKKNNNAN